MTDRLAKSFYKDIASTLQALNVQLEQLREDFRNVADGVAGEDIGAGQTIIADLEDVDQDLSGAINLVNNSIMAADAVSGNSPGTDFFRRG